MKRTAAALVSVLAFSASAMAADMGVPAYKVPPPAASIYNWGGFYVGGHVGYLWGVTENSTTILPNSTANGFFGGVQGGYRFHLPNNVVLGLQVSAPLLAQNQEYTVFGNLNHVEVNWAVMGQVHLGYAFGRYMPFAIFGMGVGEVEAWEQLAAGPRSLTVKNTHELYTLGVGINYAITDNVTTGLRYNHTFSSRERYDCGLPVCGIVGDFNMKSDTVTAVLEYKF